MRARVAGRQHSAVYGRDALTYACSDAAQRSDRCFCIHSMDETLLTLVLAVALLALILLPNVLFKPPREKRE